MPQSETYNDGTVVYGSSTLTFTPKAGGSTFTGVTDADFSPTSGSKRVEQTGATGLVIKAFGLDTPIQGSCTVQVGATAPARGDTFTSDKTSTQVYIVTESTPVFAKEDYLKVNISFIERINAP